MLPELLLFHLLYSYNLVVKQLLEYCSTMQQDKLEPSTLLNLFFSSSWMFSEGKAFFTILLKGILKALGVCANRLNCLGEF